MKYEFYINKMKRLRAPFFILAYIFTGELVKGKTCDYPRVRLVLTDDSQVSSEYLVGR